MEKTKKTIGILVEDLYNDLEFWYPYYRLKEAGAEVIVVGPGTAESHRGKQGMQAMVDTSAASLSVEQLDGIVIPGGYAPDLMRRHPAMVQLVKDVFESGKLVAAICHAGWMLASAGVAKGKRLTSFFSIRDDLVNAGADWVDEEVVVDGNLVTSRKPEDLPVFLKAILEKLAR